MEKTRIIEALGEEALRLPALLNEALVANDRAKFLFSLLQLAQAGAEHPGHSAPDLWAERQAAGIADTDFREFPAEASRLASGSYRMPGVEGLCSTLHQSLSRMIAPLEAAQSAEAGAFADRLARLRTIPWCGEEERIDAAQIARLTSVGAEGTDTVHRLVMDVHKALNRLQAEISSESIDGAHTYGVCAADRPLISAFMRGMARTQPLKFDHPGLGTTATRSLGRLVLQNDIGTTDAHVLVIHVEASRVTLTYTDVHLQRLLFFQSLFEEWKPHWDDTLSRTDRNMEDGVYHLCTGRFEAPDHGQLEQCLEFLGSRLVFLIDWNRARKRLRLLLPKRDVLKLLKWAADSDIGHVAWLRAGAQQMIFDALAFVSHTPATFGARLDDVLGREAAPRFMRFVLRTCAQGLLEGRSEALVRDEVRAELVNYFHSAQKSVLDVAASQAALALEIASGIRDVLLASRTAGGRELVKRNAQRAKDWEHRADLLVARVHEHASGSESARTYRELVRQADDIVDELEEAAFHLALMPVDGRGDTFCTALGPLAALVVDSVQEYIKAVETARTLHRGSPREDTQDFLEAIHRIMSLERRGDEIHRSVKALVPDLHGDYGTLFGFIECARNLEAASDALMHTALALRNAVMGELVVS